MFENPRRGRQATNFTTNAPKILDLKSSSEQIFSRKLPLGAPDFLADSPYIDSYLKLITTAIFFCPQDGRFVEVWRLDRGLTW